jgi:Na+/proline symporter
MLFFNPIHYALRPWPWILVALVAVVKFSSDPAFAADPESGYIRIVMTDLPVSLRGLIIAAFAAAYMSTIVTQLNWGASYLVNDFYRRFLIRGRGEKHYVTISQLTTMLLMFLSAVSTFFMGSRAEGIRLYRPDYGWHYDRRLDGRHFSHQARAERNTTRFLQAGPTEGGALGSDRS